MKIMILVLLLLLIILSKSDEISQMHKTNYELQTKSSERMVHNTSSATARLVQLNHGIRN